MSRIVLTGSGGRLGRSVFGTLTARGHEVIGVDKAGPEDATHRAVDLTAPGVAAGLFAELRPDAVVHLAAIAVPFSAPEEVIFSTNVTMAFRVIEEAVKAGVGKVIAASSPTVLGYGSPTGWLPDRLPLDESVTPRPWNAYALSKVVVEDIVRMFARTHGDSTKLAAFRPCYIITPEEWDGAPTQQGHTVAERLDDPALAAPALFNYVDARDAADFVATLLDAMDDVPNGETYFVGADDALARQPLSELLPEFVRGTDGLAAELSGTSPAFSTDKARRLLGWHPKRSWRTELALEASA